MKELLGKFCLCVVVAVLTGCTSMRLQDFFTDYTQQMAQTRIAMQRGEFDKALSFIPSHQASHNGYALSLLEQGRMFFLSQNWSKSQATFNSVYQQLEQERAKAKIQLSKGVQNIGAFVSNDSAIEYQVPAYEQSMMHSYQALNYLYQGQLESALVEVRRANLVQQQALVANEQEIFDALDDLQAQGVDANALNNLYSSMNKVIGEVKNGFQNAYTFYLSGLLYEASGALNDAYIDYKKALEIFPNNRYLQSDVMRLAQLLHMTDDLRVFSQRFAGGVAKTQPSQSIVAKGNEANTGETGELVILYEQGMITPQRATRLDLPISTRHGDMRFYSLSLPIYQPAMSDNSLLSVTFQQYSYQSEPIVKLASLAAKTLKDRLPALVSRQVLRLLAKERVRREIKQEAGDIGNILASLYNLASEQADTRSWQTLPSTVDILRLRLPVGVHSLILEHGNGATKVDASITKGGITLINLTTVGSYTGYKMMDLSGGY